MKRLFQITRPKYMKKIKLFFTLIILVVFQTLTAQVSINADGSSPDASAMLDVKSDAAGILIPRMTETQRETISEPATGLLVFQTNGIEGFYYNSGSPETPNWIQLSSAPVKEMADSDGDTKIQIEETADDDKIRFDIAGSQAMVIDESGNVGIGTNSIWASKLQIEGDERYDGILRFWNTGESGSAFFMGSTNAEWTVGGNKFIMSHGVPSYTSNNFNFTINEIGNVGIGTTTPTQKLEVNGSVKIGNYTLPLADGSSDQCLATDGSGNVSWSAKVSSNTWTESNGDVFRASGNVGIGTDNPAGNFNIFQPAVYSNEAIDQEQASANTGTSGDPSIWQSFTAGANGYLSKVEMFSSSINEGGTYIMKIYTGEGTEGSLLGTSFPYHINPSEQYGYKSFTFESPISITSSNQYTFCIITVAGENFRFPFSDDNPYSGGELSTYNYENGIADAVFKTYVASSLENKPVIFIVDDNGYVGIGTNYPSCPLEIVSNEYLTASYGYLNSSGNTGTGSGENTYSLKASHRIMAAEFNAVSDKRIKTNIVSSHGLSDLEKINTLRLTEYNFIDTNSRGNTLQKGFIAQEVEQVIPEAVRQHSGFIPDIFSLATKIETIENRVNIEVPENITLQKGDMVRLITPSGTVETEVVDIISPKTFSVKMDNTPEDIFVFGKEVDNFRAINYDYIFSTGIGAIQELSKQNEELKKQNVALRLKDEEMNARLEKVEDIKLKNDNLVERIERLELLLGQWASK